MKDVNTLLQDAKDVLEIEISRSLMTDDVTWEAAMNTMIHELLHAHKDRMCHTGEWKRCAELVNREYPIYNIKRCSSPEECGVTVSHTKYNYKVVCGGCGNVCYYTRAGKAIKKIQAYGSASGYFCTLCKSKNLYVKEM